jgi:hypothetical protein
MSQPELVSLEKTQYDAFMKVIDEIAIDINGENITLNADFKKLETLTEMTNRLVNLTNYQWTNVYSADANLWTAHSTFLWQEVHSLSALMLNKTLTDIRELERIETDHLASEFFKKLGEIDQVLSTINSAVDTIQTALGAVQTVLEVGQKTTLDGILAGITKTNELLAELSGGGLEAKILETIASSVFEINAPNIEGAELTLDACAYDPLGVGPIACAGVEGVELVLNAVEIEPVVKQRGRINKGEQTIIRSNKNGNTKPEGVSQPVGSEPAN